MRYMNVTVGSLKQLLFMTFQKKLVLLKLDVITTCLYLSFSVNINRTFEMVDINIL